MQKKTKVLAYDIGGTKVHAGIVDGSGKVWDEIRVSVDFTQGKSAVIRQWIDIGNELLKKHRQVRRVGVASAGPLDPARGLLLDPTNFSPAGAKPWGTVPIARLLSQGLGGRPVTLENDAAAAILAEHWLGGARRVEDALIITLGTGVGTGMIVDGQLVRAGRSMHTEGGHVIIKAGDSSAPCGCGNVGCAEAYLSGRGFERRFQARTGRTVSGVEIAEQARGGNRLALEAFEEYSNLLAVAIHNFVVLYAPRVVILAGSFSKASDLYLKKTAVSLEQLLLRRRHGVDFMPKLVVSKLENRSGLLGGAYVALHAPKKN